ncbi:MAG TPA: hypothetical protein VFK05_36715 [Polyangiaceae bacterium]|nr:hypothetical protein [Polyangiaceae bacterium]
MSFQDDCRDADFRRYLEPRSREAFAFESAPRAPETAARENALVLATVNEKTS